MLVEHEHIFYWTEWSERKNDWVEVLSGSCVTCDYRCTWQEFKELAGFDNKLI